MYSLTSFMGRIANDITLKFINNGETAVVNSGIFVPRDFKVNGEQYPVSDYFECVFWRKEAERLAKHCAKGSVIVVQGRMKNKNWDDENGKTHHDQELEVEHWWFADKKPLQKNDKGNG